MGLGDLLRNVADALSGDGEKKRNDPNREEGLLEKITDVLTGNDPAARPDPRVRPASEDPLGDPADQEQYGRTVLPASQDPLGDPADQLAGRNVRPASEDPLGD